MTQKHHEFGMNGAEFDEVFVRNALVHIERMSEKCLWIGIDPPARSGLPRLQIHTGTYRGKWYFRIDEDTLDEAQSFLVPCPKRKS